MIRSEDQPLWGENRICLAESDIVPEGTVMLLTSLAVMYCVFAAK